MKEKIETIRPPIPSEAASHSQARTNSPWFGVSPPQSTLILLLLLSGVLIFSRTAYLSDMEFKADERSIAETVAAIGNHAWTPLAPVSIHSGVAHSSLAYYFMRFLSGSGKQPLSIVTGIALFNVIAILLPMWLLGRQRRHLATFAMCVTSMTLIFGSRKIWEPDLQAAWICLGIGFLGSSIERTNRWSPVAACAAAFCLVMAGHMYLPAMFIAAVSCAAILCAFAMSKRWQLLRGWIVGAAIGWATVIPWAVKIVSKAPGSVGAGAADAHARATADLLRALAMGITLPSPYPVYKLYLQSEVKELFAGPYGGILTILLIFAGLACTAWMILVFTAVLTTIARRRDVLRDPLVVAFLSIFICMPPAIYLARLGNYLHYWFAALPFAYYWIAWAVERAPRASRWLSKLLVWGCVTSFLAAASLGYLIHKNQGLPGEYGRSYRAMQHIEGL